MGEKAPIILILASDEVAYIIGWTFVIGGGQLVGMKIRESLI